MKKTILGFSCLVALLLAPTFTLSAQSDVPEAVQNTFDELFPEATDVSWEQDGEEYLGTFETTDNIVEVTILEDGTWRQTTTNIDAEELPTAAIDYIKKEFVVETYYSVSKVETPAQIRYFANFETETQTVSLRFDEDGGLLEKEIEDL